jgi:hypothetical protein
MNRDGFAVPVLPGMSDRFRQVLAEILGSRRAEYDASRARLGIGSEQLWLQETPQGTLAVVYLEAGDVERAFSGIATSADPFDVWWRREIEAIYGLELTQSQDGPLNEHGFDFHRVSSSIGKGGCTSA